MVMLYKSCFSTLGDSIIVDFFSPLSNPLLMERHFTKVHFLEEPFILQLGDPCLGTVFGHIVLVIFVAHESAEFVVVHSLGFDVIVSLLAGHTENFGSLGGEKVVQFAGGVAVVVTVRLLITDTKDCDFLSVDVKIGKCIVEPVIPRGTRSLFVGTGVPRWCADDQSIGSSDFIIGRITDFVESF